MLFGNIKVGEDNYMIKVCNLKKTYRTPIKSKNVLKNIFKREYKTHTALQGISFEIPENELVGFIGPNGAGKTTTMKILAGILYPTAGDVTVFGFNPFDKKYEYLSQIAFMMGQKNQMLWELPAIDTFKLNKEIYEVPDQEYKKTVDELIALMEVEEFLYRPIKTLSLGQRMRVELISALIHTPKVLFLDEPTIGLDIFAQEKIVSFINEYQKRFKATIILTSHYMQDVQRLAKRVILIDEGEIKYDEKLQNLIEAHSEVKTITIILSKKINLASAGINETEIISHEFPQLKLKIPKKDLEHTLPRILSKIDYIDITIENESLEDIVKKSFNSSTQ